MLDQIIRSTFLGFAVFVLATSFIRISNEKSRSSVATVTEIVCLVTALVAVLFVLEWVVKLYEGYKVDEQWQMIVERLTGKYWYGMWTYIFCFGVLPQVLWVRRLRRLRFVRVTIASLLLFPLFIEVFVILVTSFHRDY